MSSIKATAAAFDLPLVKDFPVKGSFTSKGGSKTARSLNTTLRLGNPSGGTYATLEPNDLPSSVRGGRS
jgi:hypothetical protein